MGIGTIGRLGVIAALLALAGCNGTGETAGATNGPLLGLLTTGQNDLVEQPTRAASKTLSVTGPVDGAVAVMCDLSKSKLGTKVDARPEKGRPTYVLYDSNPGSTEQRDFFITGFADGCARQINAALAMFGSVELYEMVKFSGLVDVPGTATDKAYGTLRRPTCGAKKTPCTGNGLKTMAKSTAFVQAFPRKGSSSHLELLIHKGELAATAQK